MATERCCMIKNRPNGIKSTTMTRSACWMVHTLDRMTCRAVACVNRWP
jgi:hypothetical protein